MRITSTVRSSTRLPFLQTAKAAIATVAAWLIVSAVLPGELPVFAAVAALLVVQPSVNQSLGKAIERSIGVIVGVLVAYGVGLLFGATSWIVLIAIVVAIFASWALRLTPGTSNQVPISAMLVLSIGATTPDYAVNRIIETIIGAAIAITVNLIIVPPVLLLPAQQSISRLGEEIAQTLDRLAAALLAPQTPAQLEELLLNARLLNPMRDKAAADLTEAQESLAFNPRGAKHRRILTGDAELFARLPPLVTRALGMTRTLHDLYDDDLAHEPTVRAIADELTRASHDLRRLVRSSAVEAPHSPDEAEPPALTAPLVIRTPHPEHWVLLGSLLEDLRRIHEEIAAE